MGKPLLRSFWPRTSRDDTNPHATFRPREAAGYRLRKKRENEDSAVDKMARLRRDWRRVEAMSLLTKETGGATDGATSCLE